MAPSPHGFIDKQRSEAAKFSLVPMNVFIGLLTEHI